MMNVCKALNGIRTEVCHANPPLSVKMVPKLRDLGAKNEQLSGYHGQNKAWAYIQFAAKLFKVLINSLARFLEPWRGIPHVIVVT